MTHKNRPVKKKAVSGSVDPRWPKPKVVRWLEIGAIPAIAGLWFPDWLGAYGQGAAQSSLLPAFPPVLTYVGAIILLVACYQGIKGMGFHFKGVVACGSLSLVAAVSSVVLQVLGSSHLSLLFVGLAAVFATGALWFTIGKVADITQETRMRFTWWAIAASTVATAAVYLTGLFHFANGNPFGFTLLRVGVILLTVTFGLCRYGVYCYKTQTSIGAGFRSDPDEQYWATVS